MTTDGNGAADNVAYFRTDPAFANGGRRADGPDRHQLPPSALTTTPSVQFEMNYETSVAAAAAAAAANGADDGMTSRENLLAPRGQCKTV